MRNKGGAYIICELDGSVFDRPIAAFRVIPYFASKAITIHNLSDFLDISTERLGDMEHAKSAGDVDKDDGPQPELDDTSNALSSDPEEDADE